MNKQTHFGGMVIVELDCDCALQMFSLVLAQVCLDIANHCRIEDNSRSHCGPVHWMSWTGRRLEEAGPPLA